MRTTLLTTLLFFTLGSLALAADSGFSLQDHAGEYLDVLVDGKVAARYMDAHDTSTKDRRLETYKPYLTVFDAEGKEPITNTFNPKGQFPHHRGIFIGWRLITFNGKKYDRWHMIGLTDKKHPELSTKPGDIIHDKFLEEKSDAASATFTSQTHWESDPGAGPILTEERTFAFHRAAPARLVIDFSDKLTAAGDLVLDGDPEHAGIHYRPRNDVDGSKTIYVFPAANPHPHQDVDYPWVGETYTLKDGKTYSIVEMSHPDDPKNTRWSAYRDYGRLGAFFKHELKSGETLTIKYRFLIVEGKMPSAEAIEKSYGEFAGTNNPTPKVTVMPAEKPAPAKPKAK